MPTRLEYRARDPNGLGRGAGYYYLRGGKRAGSFILPSGTKVTGPYYSKYEQPRDFARKSKDWRVNRVGTPKDVASKYAHVGDGNLNNKYNR